MLPYILRHTPPIGAWFWRWLIWLGLTHFDLIYSCWVITHSVGDWLFFKMTIYTKHNHSIWLPTLGHNHSLGGDQTFFTYWSKRDGWEISIWCLLYWGIAIWGSIYTRAWPSYWSSRTLEFDHLFEVFYGL